MNNEPNATGGPEPRFTNGRSKGRMRSPAPSQNEKPQFGVADLLPFVEALKRRSKWLFLGGVTMAIVGLYCGTLLWKDSYTASAQLLRQTSAHVTEVLGDRELDPNTYASLLRSPEILQRVAAQAVPPFPIKELAKALTITPERNSDFLVIAISAAAPQRAADLANLYAREAVAFMQELQTNSATQVSLFLKQQLAPLEGEISALNQITPQLTVRSKAIARSPLLERLQSSRVELVDLLGRYTEQHPLVREQQAKIVAIENQLVPSQSVPTPGPEVSDSVTTEPQPQDRDPIFMQAKLQSLENARMTLIGQRQAAQSLTTQPPGTCRVFTPAILGEVISHKRTTKIVGIAVFCGLLGFLMIGGLVLLGEAVDTRLKTGADVQRVTGLPVIASAGDLAAMSEIEQKNWAFRTWTSLQGSLSPSANQGLVCGITSSESGEGRSTWIRLLAEAASQCGFRVLTIVACPPNRNGHASVETELIENGPPLVGSELTTQGNGLMIANNILNTPDEVTQKLIGPNPEPVVQIPLPGWVWDLKRRKQWHAALRDWSQIDNIALLVELPPASLPETVLLAENLPNLIWLADGEKATAAKTREQLGTLRNARCNLTGAVLNHAQGSFLKDRLARWVGFAVVIFGLQGLPAFCQELTVQTTNETASVANTNLSLSIVNPAQRAEWQQRLTLGPGDVVTMALWGEPALTSVEVAIGPDGRISFAEAQDVLATGLTVDELRVKMNEELGKYRRAPQVMITPVAFRSKKYYVLGRVMTKGVYILDRPITVIEAVARAHGFETGLVERNIITVADFSRSFLMRQDKRIPLNFESLFLNGDLSQNVSIEPGDYLYFPGANVKEVYVLGEVRLPGPAAFTPDLTLIGAISSRAGYTDRAYKGRVLVVRGSLNKPETFVIETKDILSGKAPDFRLQPKDIIFVNSRPFIYAEELADRAITVFLQSIVTASVGIHVIGPVQTK